MLSMNANHSYFYPKFFFFWCVLFLLFSFILPLAILLMITVYITRTSGGNFSVELPANSTVETLKSKIVASREWRSWPSNYQVKISISS